jgi:hypothetical protein
VGNQAGGAIHDGVRTTSVGDEIHPTEARQGRREPQDPPDIRQPPCVDGLVIVPDQEAVVRRGGEQLGQGELGPVEVLRLVDEEDLRACLPPCPQPVICLERAKRPGDEVVEVQATQAGELGLVGHEGPQHHQPLGVSSRGCRGMETRQLGPSQRHVHPGVELETREGVVESAQRGRWDGLTRQAADDGRALEEWLHGQAGVPEDLAAEGMEGSDPDSARTGGERLDRFVEACPQLIRGAAVERQGAHRLGWRASVDAPGDPCHERRRLAAAGGRDAQDRARWRGRCGVLVRGETCEPGRDRRVHRSSLAAAPASAVHRGLADASQPHGGESAA